MSSTSPDDLRALICDKYDGDAHAVTDDDRARLTAGEPLAYVIGWIPFLGVTVHLDSHPLTPRPETEWWTERLINTLRKRTKPFTFLDLCAGSGAIGLAVLKHLPNARVTFAEIDQDHVTLIQKNIEVNGLDESRATLHSGDLFAPLGTTRFDVIATNPPYVPEERALPKSVSAFEPYQALRAGPDGLSVIKRIAEQAPQHLTTPGVLWLECDTEHTQEAAVLIRRTTGARTEVHADQFGRSRLVVAYYTHG